MARMCDLAFVRVVASREVMLMLEQGRIVAGRPVSSSP